MMFDDVFNAEAFIKQRFPKNIQDYSSNCPQYVGGVWNQINSMQSMQRALVFGSAI